MKSFTSKKEILLYEGEQNETENKVDILVAEMSKTFKESLKRYDKTLPVVAIMISVIIRKLLKRTRVIKLLLGMDREKNQLLYEKLI